MMTTPHDVVYYVKDIALVVMSFYTGWQLRKIWFSPGQDRPHLNEDSRL